MLYKSILVSGTSLHPQSFKMMFYFILSLIFGLSIFHFFTGNLDDAVWHLVSGSIMSFFTIFTFSKKRKIFPYIQIDDNILLIKKNLFGKEQLLTPTTVDSISFSKDAISIELVDDKITISELNTDFVEEIKLYLLKTDFSKIIDQ
ncbi:MAG: hypothetical protein GDA51_13285 [Ekhidna sp.]|nr:hypothetical protein [Ekhidna sp.]MBC6410042.1 hypothetical protein [Ekhidna sp.]MBC6427406.1 hypothetical protein [Ekhidna sp.]